MVAAAIGAALVALGVELRHWMSLEVGEYPYLTFIPAIVIGAMVLGTWPALMMSVICMFITVYYYIPPVGIAIEFKDVPPLFVAMCIAMGLIYAIDLNRRNYLKQETQKRHLDEMLRNHEVMFAELQHRVANNMQFLSSMMRLQQKMVLTCDRDKLVDLYENQIARIEAMGKLHRALHNPDPSGGVLRVHLEKMCGDFVAQFGNVRCDLHGDDTKFDLSSLTAITMLVFELMTNSFKYAFRDREDGVVSVRFKADSHTFRLEFEDNGPGMRTASTNGLGSKIIFGLARQLHGEITFPQAGESRYVFVMPL